MEIVIASLNLHKIRELRDLLKSIKMLDVLSLHNFPHYTPPTGNAHRSFQENASLKALQAAKALNTIVLTDDFGLIVPSLNTLDKPNKFYPKDEAADSENRKKLLADLKNKDTFEERAAYYECCLALATPKGLKKCATALCEGMISKEERGNNGFGFDSLFIKHGYDKTFGELNDSIRNRISHRGKAFENIALTLEAMLRESSHALLH